MDELTAVTALDLELVGAARDIKVLSTLGWDPAIEARFLASWARGDPELPAPRYRAVDHGERLRLLDRIIVRAERIAHPLAKYVRDTALSYANVARMLEHLGEPRMTDFSIAVYGRPGDALSGGAGRTSLDAARFFLEVASEFYQSHTADDEDVAVSAQQVKQRLEQRLAEVFKKTRIDVVIDASLASKAAAGATRIRLRDAACFSEYDVEQLLQHEAFVHSLTAQNGREQQNLPSLGLGAPRTTAAQEGLATFAELVTGAIDIARLERIALRIIAIDMALGGADFIAVFKYFLDTGQPESESFRSTMRVFRGAPVDGGSAFTKDAVYLHGLLEVHTFFRWALKHQQMGLCERFFAGRLTLGDVIRFAPLFDDGTLVGPRLLPPWITRTKGLGGYLALAVFANNIALDELDSAHAFEALDR